MVIGDKVVKQSNLMAYVAVATDEGKASNVHKGWYSLYTETNSDSPLTTISARDQVVAGIQKQVAAYKDEELSIAFDGHSMGSTIATLNATDIVFNGYNKIPDQPDKAIPVTAFCVACPRVGDFGFSKVFAKLTNLHVLRINNELDIVPKYPFDIWYSDVGKELKVHLHTVAGYQGVFKPFELVINRDKALLNKGADYLDDKYRVVSSWWTEKNKSMVQNDDGTWELKDSEEDV
ncbi:hypothetical protein TIFTF001_012788 [Ficus carica]|uniref:Phospholipase A1 n=1 Tax=Ficus carica TaxID=3494 RepID=A0AA88D281_FICCA|nr:hypothetical protein TIFTF001_012788 [Ficus carica]